MKRIFLTLFFIIKNDDLFSQIITSTPQPNLEFLWNCKRNPEMGGDQCQAAIFFFCQGRCTRLNCAILTNRSVCIDVCGVENPQIQPCVMAGKRDPRFLSKPAIINTGMGRIYPGYNPMMGMNGSLDGGIAAIAGGIGTAASVIGKGVADTVNTIKKGTIDTVNTIGKGTTDAANTVGKGTTDTVSKISGGTIDTANTIEKGTTSTANTIGKGTTDTVSKISGGTIDTANTIGKGTTSTANTVRKGTTGTANKVKKAL